MSVSLRRFEVMDSSAQHNDPPPPKVDGLLSKVLTKEQLDANEFNTSIELVALYSLKTGNQNKVFSFIYHIHI